MKYKAASSRKNRSPRLTGFCPMLTHYLFDASHGSALQADFDPMWMRWGFCEDIFHNPLRQFAGALILLQNDEHSHTGFNGGAGLSVHYLQYSIRNKKDLWALPIAGLRHIEGDLIRRKNSFFAIIAENGFHDPCNPDVVLLCKAAVFRQKI